MLCALIYKYLAHINAHIFKRERQMSVCVCAYGLVCVCMGVVQDNNFLGSAACPACGK